VNNHRILAMLLCAAALASCDKNAVQPVVFDPLVGARIKFFNYGVNAPGVNFYADGTKITAVGSSTGSEATTGVAYGGVGNGGAYSQIAPGSYVLTGRIAATVNKDTAVAIVSATLDDGKLYSLYMSGFYNSTTRKVDAFLLEDPVTPPADYSVAYVRFVHVISNANPLILYARYTIGDTTRVDTVTATVAYKEATAFMTVPEGVYNLFARYADSTTDKVTRTGVSLIGGRVYTIGARGDITVISTTATNRPFLDQTANR
jgi:hypothetical protein